MPVFPDLAIVCPLNTRCPLLTSDLLRCWYLVVSPLACYYVTDVVTDPEYRGNGAAKQLMETMINCEELRELRGVLITKDAMPLYESVGFGNYAGTFMDRKPEILPAEEGAGEVAFEGSWLPEANI